MHRKGAAACSVEKRMKLAQLLNNGKIVPRSQVAVQTDLPLEGTRGFLTNHSIAYSRLAPLP